MHRHSAVISFPRRVGIAAASLLLGLWVVGITATRADAATGCDVNGGLPSSSTELAISVGPGTSGATITTTGAAAVTVTGVSGCSSYTSIEEIAVTVDEGATNETLTFPYTTFLAGFSVSVNLKGGTGDAVTFEGTSNAETISAGLVDDYLNVELIEILGGDGDDTLSAVNSTATNLYGEGDNDTLNGAGGADSLSGGLGNDILTGGAGADALFGNDGADTLNGGDGNDDLTDTSTGAANTLNGGAGNDTLTSGAQGDTLSGGDGDDEIDGGAGNDTITGGAGNDAIADGDGNDTVNGGDGNDTFDQSTSAGASEDDDLTGGAGTDTADYSGRSGNLTITLNGTNGDGEGGESDNVRADVENLLGGSGKDKLTGSSANNLLDGGDDDDELKGEGGNDTFIGGAGDDDFWGSTGVDTISYLGETDDVTFDLTSGLAQYDDDQVKDAPAIENLLGGSGDDTLTGTAGANLIGGHTGNDVIRGGAGADLLDGSTGVDTVSYDDATATTGVTVNLGAETASGGFAAGDTIVDFEKAIGSDYADSLTGSAGANTLWGGDGNDTLVGLGGADKLYGESGAHDKASYAASDEGVEVSLALGSGEGGDAEGDTLSKVEDLVGSDETDTLVGSSVSNNLSGGDGNDFLSGGLSGDKLDGGAGKDTVSYASADEGVTVNLRTGTVSGGDTDTLTSIENVIGSSYADRLTGGNGNNSLTGGAGNDTIYGLGGGDKIYGGTGADLLYGGDGADRIEGGDGADKLDGGAGTDTCKPGMGKNTVTNCP